MKKYHSLIACVGTAVLVSACASASSKSGEKFEALDKDGDGFLSPQEYSASKLAGAISIEELDVDQDGMLSPFEMEFDDTGDRRLRDRRRKVSRFE